MQEIPKARDSAVPLQPLTCVVEIPKGSRNKYEYVVLARPIALLEMEDEHGIDPHVLCVPIADPGWNQLERLEDLPTQLVAEIGHFFAVYKDLDDNRRSTVCGWRDYDAAQLEIEESRRRYLEHSRGREATVSGREQP
jgi:inorganic pyrophosphatase